MERFNETRNILKAFLNEEELISDSIENITTSIEDILIAEIGSSIFEDDDIAVYSKELSHKIVMEIVEYLKANKIPTSSTIKSLESI